MITRARISAVRASGCGAYSRTVLINFFVPDAALIRVNTVSVLSWVRFFLYPRFDFSSTLRCRRYEVGTKWIYDKTRA